MKVVFYDRVKNFMMPLNPAKYNGLDFFIRSQIAAICCMSLTLAATYPLDMLHTRMAADSTPNSRSRVYSSTFQCFNRTNLDEGRYGLYKGI